MEDHIYHITLYISLSQRCIIPCVHQTFFCKLWYKHSCKLRLNFRSFLASVTKNSPIYPTRDPTTATLNFLVSWWFRWQWHDREEKGVRWNSVFPLQRCSFSVFFLLILNLLILLPSDFKIQQRRECKHPLVVVSR